MSPDAQPVTSHREGWEGVALYRGDCLQVMPQLEGKSVDLILADLPYGSTSCRWDAVIPFEPLWEQYKRLLKPGGSAVFTAIQPFTSALVMSNPRWFRHHWIYRKTKATNFVRARTMPMRYHEDVLVFCQRQPLYHPQMEEGEPYHRVTTQEQAKHGDTPVLCTRPPGTRYSNPGTRFPSSVLHFSNPSGRGQLHPTQKPVDLMEYLIRTYSDPGMVVLDNVMGSGTTGVACLTTGRKFIGIEQEERYFQAALTRLAEQSGVEPDTRAA